MVTGSWVIGGVERYTNDCFLDICPNNFIREASLLPIIQKNIAAGTLVITEKWMAYINLNNHGYIHKDVNHSAPLCESSKWSSY